MFKNLDNMNIQGSIPDTSVVKSLLSESNTFMSERYRLNPQNINDFAAILVGENGEFESYIESLVEGMSESDAAFIKQVAPNIRQRMLWEMNTSGNINPYQKLVFPLLRVYYPRLVAKELVSTYAMDTENVELRILVPYGVDANGNRVRLPGDVSGMDGTPIPEDWIDLSSKSYVGNLKALAGIPNAPGPVQKTLKILEVSDALGGAGNTVVINVTPDVYGSFYAEVNLGGNDDIITGNVNWETGAIVFQSANDVVKSFKVRGTISYQGRGDQTPDIEFRNETIALRSTEKGLKAKWTIETEQDAKALLDLNYQAELLAVIASQISYKIDKDIVGDLVDLAQTAHPAAVETFSRTPSSTYYTIKDYYNTIGIYLDRVSQRIFSDTNIAAGNVWAVNPNDAPILAAVNGYSLVGDMTADADFQTGAYQVGTISNKYTILVSNIVPEGKLVNVMNTRNVQTATYLYGVYQALYAIPRIVNDGSMMVELKSRVAQKPVRTEGIGLLNIT